MLAQAFHPPGNLQETQYSYSILERLHFSLEKAGYLISADPVLCILGFSYNIALVSSGHVAFTGRCKSEVMPRDEDVDMDKKVGEEVDEVSGLGDELVVPYSGGGWNIAAAFKKLGEQGWVGAPSL
jgi:hypothetical protein